MPTLRTRLVVFAMRNRHLLQGRLKPQAWDMSTSIPDFRALCERQASRMAQMPAGVAVEPLEVAGMQAEWLRPAGAGEQRMILYFHGGGYISGSCSDHRNMVAKLAAGTGLATLQFEYRLAPEHPYPAALEDALTAYRWVLDHGHSPDQIIFAGESAGGGLTLAALLAAKQAGLPMPVAAVAMSPMTDLTLGSESMRTNARLCLSPPGMNEVCVAHYVGDHDPTDPGISPLYGDLHGLPPLHLSAGGHESLRDDATRFAAKAQAAGVDVTLLVGEGMFHCYPLMAPLFPEATQALDEICAFIQQQCERQAAAIPA